METIFDKPLNSAVASNTQAIANLDDLVKTVLYSGSYTCSASSAVSITGTMIDKTSNPEGYIPIAISQYSTNNNSVVPRSINPTASGSGSVAVLRNLSTNDVTATFQLAILYVKDAYYTN